VQSSIRSRRLPTQNKPSVCARQAAINAARKATESSRFVVDHIAPPVDARTFARQIRDALDGKLLHYSDRMSLLREADRMGIGRFEANLLIATVQHRAQQETFVSQASSLPEARALEARTTKNTRAARILMFTTALLTAEFFVLRFAIHAISGI
jgi:hypothetical protein